MEVITIKIHKRNNLVSLILLLIILLIPTEVYANSSTDYDIRTSTNVTNNKQWKIKFNKELDSSTVNNTTILVQDEQNNIIPTNITLDSDNKTIILKPSIAYTEGIKYKFIVTNNVKSKDGKFLKKPVKMEFIIKTVIPTVDKSGYFYNMSSLINKDTIGWSISNLKYEDGTKVKLYIGICADVKGKDLTKENEQLMKAGLYVHTKTYLTINEYMKRTVEIYNAGGDGIFIFNASYSLYINNTSPIESTLLGDKVAMNKWYYFQYNAKPVVKSVIINKA